MNAKARRAAATAALGLAAALSAAAGGDRDEARPSGQSVGVVHLHTRLVDGRAAPVDLARQAREAGVEVLVVTDHLVERIVWAPWPIGHAFGAALEHPSVLAGGARAYDRALEDAGRAVPGVTIVPGAEASPYARWSGSWARGTLELQGWHRHVLLLGLAADDLAALPVAGSRGGREWNARSLLFLLPGVLLVHAVRRLLTPEHREVRLRGFRLRRRRIPAGTIALGAAAAVVAVLGFPWKVEAYSPIAAADPGPRPFVDLERAVHARGGLVLWAHPEAAAERLVHGVRLRTAPYDALVGMTAADGFAALPEGIVRLLPAGGGWDAALLAYVRGERAAPLYAFAESDEHGAPADLRTLQTVFLSRDLGRPSILGAIRRGRMYARWTPEGAPPLWLETWEVSAATDVAGAGGTLRAAGTVRVRAAIGGGSGVPVEARIVRSGRVIRATRAVPPFTLEFEDAPEPPAYYRIDVEGAYPSRLVGNPIFVRTAEGA